LGDSDDSLGGRRQGEVRGRFLLRQLLRPGDELIQARRVGHRQPRISIARTDERKVDVVRLRREEVRDERVEHVLVEFRVDLSSVDRLAEETPDGVPGDGGRIDVGTSLGRTGEPRVDDGESSLLVRVVELVHLAPSEGYVAQTFLYDSVEPREEEVQAGLLCGSTGESGRRDRAERFEDVGADAWRRLVHEHTSLPENVDGDRGVRLHREEEAERPIRVETLQSLLELREP
jgi:hypothetical protein